MATTVGIRVELPAYSLSFHVHVPISATILDVKHEIGRACTGQPRVDGQRIIWRGRLLRDDEKVDELWKSPDDPRIVHLSVHPSAWASSPPEQPSAPSESLPSESLSRALADLIPPAPTAIPIAPSRPPTPYQAIPSQAPLIDTQLLSPLPPQPRRRVPVNSTGALLTPPLTYVLFRHNNALLAVMQGDMVPESDPEEMRKARALAVETITHFGWAWPSLIDAPYPPSDGSAGARYVRTQIRGQDYLQLETPDAAPTPAQAHALKVLAYTFPLLSLTLPNAVATANVRAAQGTRNGDIHPAMLPELNAHLQQLGIPPVRAGPRARLELFRPLLAPMAFLALRAVILLYIFSPTRKPFVALAIATWVVYEVTRQLERIVFEPMRADVRAAERGLERVRAAAEDAARARGVPANLPPAPPRLGEVDARTQVERVMDAAADLNLSAEERALAARPEDAGNARVMVPPSAAHRAASFGALFLSTLHPAVWNRRRAALHRREGQLRTEAHARERELADEELPEDLPEAERTRRREEADKARLARDELVQQHARRPQWVKEYVERVRGGDWADHE